jgi:thioredoxin reductase
MTMTVDVVVIGANQSALNAAVESAHSGKRVLVISTRRGPELRRRVRQARAAAGRVVSKRIVVLTGVEVECIAGIRSVEAVLARYVQGGRRVDVNATALLTFADEPETGITGQ